MYTAGLALLELGPSFRYETRVYYTGHLRDDGTLKGDLLIRGVGDPTMGKDGGINPENMLRSWARALVDQGIRRIEGAVMGDPSEFSGEVLGEGWSWDNESYYFCPQISALSLNGNCMEFTLKPEGKTLVSVSCFPDVSYMSVENAVVIDSKKNSFVDFRRQRGQNHVYFFGSLKPNDKPLKSLVTVENPSLFFAAVFTEMLRKEGIVVRDGAKAFDSRKYVRDQAHTLLIYRSKPLQQIVTKMQKDSVNLDAELILRTVGAQKGRGTVEGALNILKKHLRNAGISPKTMSIKEGCGLSRHNYWSPLDNLKWLTYMAQGPQKDNFQETFAVMGRDGTLKNRLKGTLAEGRVRAKSGGLIGVHCLTGYLTTQSGEPLVFSIAFNNDTASAKEINQLIDQMVLEWVVFSRH